VAAAFSRNDILAALRWSLAVFGKFLFIIFITGPLVCRNCLKTQPKVAAAQKNYYHKTMWPGMANPRNGHISAISCLSNLSWYCVLFFWLSNAHRRMTINLH